ncbi:MAG: heavy metal-binding domain-containing protein [Acidimicrobiales bacterium]
MIDRSGEMRRAMNALAAGPHAGGGRGTTSDLSVDESLLLHAIGWEPVDMVFGVSWWSVPWGSWQWQTGEIGEASTAFAGAMDEAAEQLRAECTDAGGSGVVGVEIALRVASHHVDVSLSGTAVRRVRGPHHGFEFLSDLSARDFSLLTRSGWWPLGLVTGASFVVAPRRSGRQWVAQQGQNLELPNLTQALYQAREGAMDRMQQAGRAMGADGVINVKLREGPLGYSARIMQFVAVGTAVHLREDAHRRIGPSMVVPLDDAVREFDVKSLRGAG